MFHKRHQAAVENIVCDLRKLIKFYNFGNIEERLLRDQIVLGVKNESLRTKLLEIRNLTLVNTLQGFRNESATEYGHEDRK